MLAIWSVFEITAFIKYWHYLGFGFEKNTTSVVEFKRAESRFLCFPFLFSLYRSKQYSKQHLMPVLIIPPWQHYTTPEAFMQFRSLRYKRSCLLFEHLLWHTFLGFYIRTSVTVLPAMLFTHTVGNVQSRRKKTRVCNNNTVVHFLKSVTGCNIWDSHTHTHTHTHTPIQKHIHALTHTHTHTLTHIH